MGDSDSKLGEILKAFTAVIILLFLGTGFVFWIISQVESISVSDPIVIGLVSLVPLTFAIAFLAIRYKNDLGGE